MLALLVATKPVLARALPLLLALHALILRLLAAPLGRSPCALGQTTRVLLLRLLHLLHEVVALLWQAIWTGAGVVPLDGG